MLSVFIYVNISLLAGSEGPEPYWPPNPKSLILFKPTPKRSTKSPVAETLKP